MLTSRKLNSSGLLVLCHEPFANKRVCHANVVLYAPSCVKIHKPTEDRTNDTSFLIPNTQTRANHLVTCREASFINNTSCLPYNITCCRSENEYFIREGPRCPAYGYPLPFYVLVYISPVSIIFKYFVFDREAKIVTIID